MPHHFSTASDDDLRVRGRLPDPFGPKHNNVLGRTWHKMGSWLKKDEDRKLLPSAKEAETVDDKPVGAEQRAQTAQRRSGCPVVPELPRPMSSKRQESERRERLCPHEPDAEERRASSVDRRTAQARLSKTVPPPVPRPSFSVPNMRAPQPQNPSRREDRQELESVPQDPDIPEANPKEEDNNGVVKDGGAPPQIEEFDPDFMSDGEYDRRIQAELEAKWFLNLSMHHRDGSDREKYFVTYAEEPNKWRRVTVSVDYRNAEPDSLEEDIKREEHWQRDKSDRIFKSIRDYLTQIKFYPTVTNLKLQTTGGRLHIQVTEDVKEIIPYPSVSKLRHIPEAEIPRFVESEIKFDAHMSGFVYKVRCPGGRCLVKKEIPGPEAVEEFLYEIDALYNLRDSANVIRLEGLVVSDDGSLVKGLLIKYASEGALVDMLYDFKNSDYLPWDRRLKWAHQIVAGLRDLHEAGFTQGDFTLSNIVIDRHDNAKIIDINRRGCPVGWEPPELVPNIRSGQRISMRIGPKTDLFQLGMVLWALAEENDEPERQPQPFKFTRPEVPAWYKEVVATCLSKDPRNRTHAKGLEEIFQKESKPDNRQHASASMSLAPDRLGNEFIDPAAAVSREDIDHLRIEHERELQSRLSGRSIQDSEATFAEVEVMRNAEYAFEASENNVAGHPDVSPRPDGFGGFNDDTTQQARNWDHVDASGRSDEKVTTVLSPPVESPAMLFTDHVTMTGQDFLPTPPPSEKIVTILSPPTESLVLLQMDHVATSEKISLPVVQPSEKMTTMVSSPVEAPPVQHADDDGVTEAETLPSTQPADKVKTLVLLPLDPPTVQHADYVPTTEAALLPSSQAADMIEITVPPPVESPTDLYAEQAAVTERQPLQSLNLPKPPIDRSAEDVQNSDLHINQLSEALEAYIKTSAQNNTLSGASQNSCSDAGRGTSSACQAGSQTGLT